MHLSISHNAPFKTERCTFLFWMVHCEMWDRCIVGFVRLVYHWNPAYSRCIITIVRYVLVCFFTWSLPMQIRIEKFNCSQLYLSRLLIFFGVSAGTRRSRPTESGGIGGSKEVIMHCDIEGLVQNNILTHWGLVTPYGVIDVGQHWFR